MGITFDPRDTVGLSLPRYADDPKEGDPELTFKVPTRAEARKLDAALDRVQGAGENTENESAAKILDACFDALKSLSATPETLDELVTDADVIDLVMRVRMSGMPGRADRGN
jgi:hypothetical protein